VKGRLKGKTLIDNLKGMCVKIIKGLSINRLNAGQ
jgi:hypothetical protein